MATKRKYQQTDLQESVHESRQSQVYGNTSKPAKKPRRFEPPAQRKQAHASSVNAIKKRLRDVTRRLERAEDLPADVRIESERALAAYQQELASAQAEKTRQKMIKKYHMVRFFERQKATRLLKKLRKRLLVAVSREEVETLKAQMHVAEVDLNYTQYFPLGEPYISLYPQKTSSTDDPDLSKEATKPKPPLWSEVEKCMENGTLTRLRNRITAGSAQVSKPLERKPIKAKAPTAPIDTTGMNRRERRSQRGAKESRTQNKSMAFAKNEAFGASQNVIGGKDAGQNDDDSDGGFFEE
ncbi:hypothetical protein N431DRAFT_364250 [Stipitochalara longipes BDJ]|nr:hypothetical protein N431DRAFT_364250 [Stipitochalara longipes BDJ]